MDWTPSERSSAALPLASRGCKVITGEPAMTDEENPLLNSAKVELSEDLMEGPLICPASKKKKMTPCYFIPRTLKQQSFPGMFDFTESFMPHFTLIFIDFISI